MYIIKSILLIILLVELTFSISNKLIAYNSTPIYCRTVWSRLSLNSLKLYISVDNFTVHCSSMCRIFKNP